MDRAIPTNQRSADPRQALEAMHGDCWRWARVCVRGDEDLAMDALHDSYVAILDGRARFAGKSSFRTFVFGVIRMTARTVRRRAVVRGLLFAPAEDGKSVAVAPSQECAVRTHRVEAALGHLSPRQRTITELVLLNDFTVAEAATILGISRGSASRHYADAKAKLRKELSEAVVEQAT